MYTVIIVDDEKMVIESIKGKIKWDALSLSLVAEAGNGRDALDKIIEYSPEIAIIDMKMPVMDGHELLIKLEEAGCSTRIIISSAYTDYEYTRRAIHSHVVDYLVKPLKIEELNQSMQKAIMQVNDMRRNEERFLSSLLTSRDYVLAEEALEKHSLGKGHIALIATFLSTEATKQAMQQVSGSLARGGVSSSVTFVNQERRNEVISIIGLGNDELDSGEEDLYNRTLAIASVVFSEIEGKGLRGDVCISLPGRKPNDIPSLYAQAVEAFKTRNLLTREVRRSDLAVCVKTFIRLSEEEKFALRYLLNHGSRDNICVKILDIVGDLCVDDWLQADYFMNMVTEITFMINEMIGNTGDEVVRPEDLHGIAQIAQAGIETTAIFEAIKNRLQEFLGPAIDRIVLNRLIGTRKIMHEIKRQIDSNYFMDIGLKELSRKYFLSEEYLSKRFKEQFGEGFSDYVTRVRLFRAKDLILNTTLKMYEISVLVGYQDAKYFCRLFKKYFQLTPMEMRDSICRSEL